LRQKVGVSIDEYYSTERVDDNQPDDEKTDVAVQRPNVTADRFVLLLFHNLVPLSLDSEVAAHGGDVIISDFLGFVTKNNKHHVVVAFFNLPPAIIIDNNSMPQNARQSLLSEAVNALALMCFAQWLIRHMVEKTSPCFRLGILRVLTMVRLLIWVGVVALRIWRKNLPDFRRDVTYIYPRMDTEETILTTKDTKHAKKEIIQANVFDTLVYNRINEITQFRDFCDFRG
jgi:hypothetical protein